MVDQTRDRVYQRVKASLDIVYQKWFEQLKALTSETPERNIMRKRLFHAFKWQTVVDIINNQTKGIVLLASPSEDSRGIVPKLGDDAATRVIQFDSSIYDGQCVETIIRAANKPQNQTWSEWGQTDDNDDWWWEELAKRSDALQVSLLVLLDHPNRTQNLHRIISETNLTVISSTEQGIKKPIEGSVGKSELEPNARKLYGRPTSPDFNNLSDEEHERFLRDGVSGLDSLIPVYDFNVQSFNHKQLMDTSLEARAELVRLQDGQTMLWGESITEIFAWRATGKTMFSLGLALHMAAGKDMPGLMIPKKVKVLYVEGELPKSQMQERIKQLSQHLDIPPGNFTLIAKSLQPRDTKQSSVTIKTEAGRLAIEAEIERTCANVVILDSIASLAQINTNNEEQWLPIIEWMVELRCRGICVIYLQQAGKGGEQRGHSVSEDRIDLAVRLTATRTNPDGAAFEMTFTKEREGSLTPLRLACTKGVWYIDAGQSTEKAPPARRSKKTDKETEIKGALERGDPQRTIAKKFRVSMRTVNAINKKRGDDDVQHSNPHDSN